MANETFAPNATSTMGVVYPDTSTYYSPTGKDVALDVRTSQLKIFAIWLAMCLGLVIIGVILCVIVGMSYEGAKRMLENIKENRRMDGVECGRNVEMAAAESSITGQESFSDVYGQSCSHHYGPHTQFTNTTDTLHSIFSNNSTDDVGELDLPRPDDSTGLRNLQYIDRNINSAKLLGSVMGVLAVLIIIIGIAEWMKESSTEKKEKKSSDVRIMEDLELGNVGSSVSGQGNAHEASEGGDRESGRRLSVCTTLERNKRAVERPLRETPTQ
ncbi:uncharacterized protein PAC_05918 [Phialocephala subalpina]|uniref:Uncharacterized protein n=1 Tax=Phialocephala subalpina TaxID=576137 RepID=A0A1L7WTD6_9HELO|nr:uncharacterized protein PAC_05918 [Phialocephala subalpina]